jgi:hypothetical protein
VIIKSSGQKISGSLLQAEGARLVQIHDLHLENITLIGKEFLHLNSVQETELKGIRISNVWVETSPFAEIQNSGLRILSTFLKYEADINK